MSLSTLWRSHWSRLPRVEPSIVRTRLGLEQLEDRTVPAHFTATSVADLIADISEANLAGGANTITLRPGTSYRLNAMDNTNHGPTGLPTIVADHQLTIIGNGNTLKRASSSPAFRLFDVASGASLTLLNMTLQGGLATGTGVAAQGGAIRSEGELTLRHVTVRNNTAQGSLGIAVTAAGGGIWSSGELTLADCIIQDNSVLGGRGRNAIVRRPFGVIPARPGGDGLGGGVCVSDGNASLTNVELSSNTASGGDGGNGTSRGSRRGANGGDGFGGGLCILDGDVQLIGVVLESNFARHGEGGSGSPDGRDGVAEGGTLAIDTDALCFFDLLTAKALGSKNAENAPEVYGSWTLLLQSPIRPDPAES